MLNPQAVGDMNIYRNGKPVRARGIWQITQAYHPEISDSEAFDPIWSTEYVMPILKNKKLCEQEFTTCRIYYNQSSDVVLATR
jgi:hypothetical protein